MNWDSIRRVGVVFTEEQKEMIRLIVKGYKRSFKMAIIKISLLGIAVLFLV